MEDNRRFWVMGDIHGEFGHLIKLMRLIRKNGFSFKRGDVLVQLGDRCDRGPDTFRVNNFFYKLEKRYPGQVICLKGNHEDMMIKAVLNNEPANFMNNGGNQTMKSYRCFSKSPSVLLYKLEDCGHLKWLDAQPIFYETDKYLFTHAPIPIKGMGARRDDEFRNNPEVCFWSYGGENLEYWVDPEVVPGKISVHGHIHGMYRSKGGYISPGVRQIGNAFMIDGGAGCHPTAGYLICLELSTMTEYNSKGQYEKQTT